MSASFRQKVDNKSRKMSCDCLFCVCQPEPVYSALAFWNGTFQINESNQKYLTFKRKQLQRVERRIKLPIWYPSTLWIWRDPNVKKTPQKSKWWWNMETLSLQLLPDSCSKPAWRCLLLVPIHQLKDMSAYSWIIICDVKKTTTWQYQTERQLWKANQISNFSAPGHLGLFTRFMKCFFYFYYVSSHWSVLPSIWKYICGCKSAALRRQGCIKAIQGNQWCDL